jgi:hypothetical protein
MLVFFHKLYISPLLQCRICRNKPGCTSGPKYRVKLGEDPEPQRCSFIYHLAHHHGKLVDGESSDDKFPVLWIRIRVFFGLPDLHPDPEPQRCSFIYHLAHHHGKLVDGESSDDKFPVLWIRISVFFGLPDPHPDPEPQRCSFIYHLAHHHGKLVDGE